MSAVVPDDLTGRVFGCLTVIKKAGRNKHGHRLWKCRCSCDGKIRIVRAYSLRGGKTRSCGCLKRNRLSLPIKELRKLYKEGKTVKAIAKIFGCSRGAIRARLGAERIPLGRPRSEVSKLAEREGISRQAAWFRLRRATGKPRGRPPGRKTTERGTES